MRRLEEIPWATVSIALVVTAVTLVEAAMGPAMAGPDRLTHALGLWPDRMPVQLWRLVTGVLVNPSFRTRTTSLSLFDHWAVNMALLVAAGRRVERRLGVGPVVAACLGGALASGLWEWVRFPSGGPNGGTSGASFGILGAAIVLGLWAGGGYRRYALAALAFTVLVLSWMYPPDGVYFHLIAMGGGASASFSVAAGWARWRHTPREAAA